MNTHTHHPEIMAPTRERTEREQRDTITPAEQQTALELALAAAAERERLEAELARIESWQRDREPLRQLANYLTNVELPMAHSRETADVLFLVKRHLEIAVRALRLRICEF
ncbi:MAG: hypothetical protein Q8M16_07190 [Pirellulaceae bacterium]|nr:hypothetical protein [Pirellulaceae bacterium]